MGGSSGSVPVASHIPNHAYEPRLLGVANNRVPHVIGSRQLTLTSDTFMDVTFIDEVNIDLDATG